MDLTLYLPLISAFLQAVNTFIANNWPSAAQDVLGTAIAAIGAGEQGYAGLQSLTEHMQAMIAKGTDPTADDWAELKARSDAAHAAIQGAQS